MRNKPCKYGTHRVISPDNALPQNAQTLDNSLPIYENELLINVDTLNIVSASFRQMKDACKGDIRCVENSILRIVKERGKQQNPVTGSGGMLLGTVKEMGNAYSNPKGFKRGDRVASLVSLSLTPLHIDKILQTFPERDQVKIKGYAIFFESGILAKIPDDIAETLALSILDVAGAPAQTQRLVKPGQNVVILGAGGKSGSLCAAVTRDILGDSGRLIAIQPSDRGCERIQRLGYCDAVLQVDAKDPVACERVIAKATNHDMADLVINCAPVEDTEMSSILVAKKTNDAMVYFFGMATNFTKAALGAEGIGSDVRLIIGNGYVPNHDDIAFDILRRHSELRKLFEELYNDGR